MVKDLSMPVCRAQHMSKESQRVARYRARMETVDKWMAKRRLPLKLRSRIGHYYAEVSLP